MNFGAIVTAHANPEGLRHMLGNLIYQSRKPDDILVLASGLTSIDFSEIRIDFNAHARMLVRPDLSDYGIAKRDEGTKLAHADVIGFFNDDDSYDIDYVDRMMWEIEHGADYVYCHWTDGPFTLDCPVRVNSILRRSLALRAGHDIDVIRHKRDKHGDYPVIARVPDVLYHHNAGPQRG